MPLEDELKGMTYTPGLTDYLQMRQYMQNRDLRDQQVQQQQQFMQERAALPQDAPLQDYLRLGMKYLGPEGMAKYGEQEAANKQKYDYFNNLLDSKLQQIQNTHESNMARIKDAETRTTLTEAKNNAENQVKNMQLELDRLYKMTRLQIEKDKVTQGDKPPSGYRKTAEGNLEPIPGGPADLKIQGQFNQDTAMLQSSQADLDRLQREAQTLLKHPGLPKTTGKMSLMPGVGGVATIPGTDAANFKAGLETLKSQTGFSVLQNMRNNSKTGGALGQVSDFENRLLQANLASLDRAQSEPEFKAALEKIVKYTEDAKTRLRGAYNLKHKTAPSGGQSPEGVDPRVWAVMTPQERALWQNPQ